MSNLRCLPYAVVVSLLMSLWCEVVIAGQVIHIVRSSDSPPYQLAVEAMVKTLEEDGVLANYSVKHWVLDEFKAEDKVKVIAENSFIITVGSAAAEYAVNHISSRPIICSFITRNAFDVIRSKSATRQSLSAVFIDQPIKRLIQISTLLRKEQSPYKIGLLSQSVITEQSWAVAAIEPSEEIKISSMTLSLNENPIRQIEPLIKNNDIFIIRPSTSLFNRLTAKLVLQLSMRYKTPVIGFSEKYSKAGALLSLYASPENIGIDTSKLIGQWLLTDQKMLPPPREGEQFSIAINTRIAKKQNISLDAVSLRRELENMEGQ